MLHVNNLHLSFHQSHILKNIDFHVKRGEIVGLIGPNGCGKTTFLNALSGFVKPHSGSILFCDENIIDLVPAERSARGMGRSFQTAGVFKEMTVEENLLVALEKAQAYPWYWKFFRAWRDRADKVVDELLSSVDLLTHKYSLAGVLSGGQLRLLELLRLRLSGGQLLLIDEPTAGVSPAMKKVLGEQLRALIHNQTRSPDEGCVSDEGCGSLDGANERSMILVEHDLKFLFDLVDRVVVFVEGGVYMEGRPEDIVNDPKLKEVYFGTR